MGQIRMKVDRCQDFSRASAVHPQLFSTSALRTVWKQLHQNASTKASITLPTTNPLQSIQSKSNSSSILLHHIVPSRRQPGITPLHRHPQSTSTHHSIQTTHQ